MSEKISQNSRQRQKSSRKSINMNQLYRKLLVQWIQYITQCSYNKQLMNSRLFSRLYIQKFIKPLQQIDNYKIRFDRRVCEVIISMFKQMPNYRIFAVHKQEIKIQECFQNADILFRIAEELKQQRYITKSMFQNIQQQYQQDITEQRNLQAKISKIIQEFDSYKIDYSNKLRLQQIWEKHFNQYSFQSIWKNLIVKNREKLGKQKVEKLFKIYEMVIQSKKDKQFSICLRAEININSIKKSQLLEHLTIHGCIPGFKNQKQIKSTCRQTVQKQLGILFGKIKQLVSHQYPFVQLKFQTFGSYRSGFQMSCSDYDITIFTKFQESDRFDSNPDILHIMEEYFAKKQPYYAACEYIKKAKIPVLKLCLKNNKQVREVDIVLNNAHGVENSRFLSYYSLNNSIKLFVLMVKKWAKSFGLVDKTKMSSYSITLMAIYYLMKKKKLQYVKRVIISQKNSDIVAPKRGNRILNQRFKTKVLPNAELQKQIDLHEDFIQFLQFYKSGGKFHQQNQIVCLLDEIQNQKYYQETGRKHCLHNHQRILYKSNSLINIHDPFDDSNPGRMREDCRHQFEKSIEQTLQKLKSNNVQKILKVFTIDKIQPNLVFAFNKTDRITFQKYSQVNYHLNAKYYNFMKDTIW